MANDWSVEEVAATVTDYLSMLEAELRGERYNKAEHNRALQTLLRGRSQQAIEFKHANISAVLIEMGYPYIDGYKPRGNYQELLREEVERRLADRASLAEAAEAVVTAAVTMQAPTGALADMIVPIPPRRPRTALYERARRPPAPRRDVNYLEREARNTSLGLAGEEFVLALESRRLWEAGAKRLSEQIEHVARTQGDGLGYDILSYEESGRERLIEVKTTGFGAHTPFFASAREVTVSEERAGEYALYRLFRFRDDPKLFIVPGALRDRFELRAVQYRASVA